MGLLQVYRSVAFSAFGLLQFTKAAFLEHVKKFKDEDMCVDMSGKNCIVTGSNSGIGFATAKALASRGASVYMVCRNKERGVKAVSEIKSNTGNESVYLEVCDLSSLKQVKDFAARFTASNLPLHVLVNNAGLMEHERKTTADGLELNFAVNVASVYVMTNLLLSALEKAAPDARVITVSSGGMYTVPLLSDLQVALTEKWAEEYGPKGIRFYAMHPGWADTPAVAKSLPKFKQMFENKLRTSEQGADTVVWLALQPNHKLQSGGFFFDRAEARKHLPGCGTTYSPAQIDSIVASIRSLCSMDN